MTDPELLRAWHLNESHRFAESEVWARRVLEGRPRDEWALRLLTSALVNQDRKDEAFEVARWTVQEHPNEILCWIQLASVHASRREPEAAVAAAQQAVSIAPTDARTHHSLSGAYQTYAERWRPHTSYDPERALLAADEAVRLAPDQVRYRNTRAWVLILLKRWKEAEQAYRAVLAIAPDDATALNGMGWRHRRWRPILAARYYAMAATSDPQMDVIKINIKGAVRSWVDRMIWIWISGGLALGVLRWAIPRPGLCVGLLSLIGACLVGTLMLVRHLPRGSFRMLRGVPWNPLVPITGRLLFVASLACVCALGSTVTSLCATALLAALAPIQWKAKFPDIDHRIARWLRRPSTLGARRQDRGMEGP